MSDNALLDLLWPADTSSSSSTSTPSKSWLDSILNSGTTLFGQYLNRNKPATTATTSTATKFLPLLVIGAAILVVVLLVRR